MISNLQLAEVAFKFRLRYFSFHVFCIVIGKLRQLFEFVLLQLETVVALGAAEIIDGIAFSQRDCQKPEQSEGLIQVVKIIASAIFA